MSYDTKCYELAQSFLEDANMASVRQIHELAQEIQDTIESFIESEQREVPE
jgi:hypothetical protein